MKGIEKFRKTVAKYMLKRFVSNVHAETFQINPSNLICSSGCDFLVNSLGWCLAESGDSCILPAPYYTCFENNLSMVSNINTVPAFLRQEQSTLSWILTESSLEDAYTRSMDQGHRPAMLLITNPNNPTGSCYSAEELKMALSWARKKGMFLICDEIYANTTHTTTQMVDNHHVFTSMFNVALSIPTPTNEENIGGGVLGDDVLVMYGFSKDFGLSGLRVGILYTENRELHDAHDNLSSFSAISSDTQCLLNDLLADDQWVSMFLEENNRRLSSTLALLMSLLDSMKIPYIRPTSGMFIVLDLREFMEGESWEHERLLFDKIVSKCQLLLTPGRDFSFQVPGFFRATYAHVHPETLVTAFHRLRQSFLTN
uniref:Aminotransferase class I/classII large domain-containing protein n=1 Tax=Aplanochytrium stocchinoi TaxID=215587 RepID=A0A7S3PHN6_9STRA